MARTGTFAYHSPYLIITLPASRSTPPATLPRYLGPRFESLPTNEVRDALAVNRRGSRRATILTRIEMQP